jgi:hypothetical protein
MSESNSSFQSATTIKFRFYSQTDMSFAMTCTLKHSSFGLIFSNCTYISLSCRKYIATEGLPQPIFMPRRTHLAHRHEWEDYEVISDIKAFDQLPMLFFWHLKGPRASRIFKCRNMSQVPFVPAKHFTTPRPQMSIFNNNWGKPLLLSSIHALGRTLIYSTSLSATNSS